MKRIVIVAALAVALFALAGCQPQAPATQPGGGSSTATASAPASGTAGAPTEARKSILIGTAKKTELLIHTVKVYDPAKFPKTSMNGEPSDIPFFKPEKDEGVLNRDYPAYDSKTFKFLSLTAGAVPPQSYYMFDKDGGTLNKALKGSGYKAVNMLDQGHIKILPNFYVGYYDFAWVPLNVITEYWSGNESMSQELWRDGNDYVIVGNSYNGGISLIAPPDVTEIDKLAGQKVGIMNPSFNIETLFNKKLVSEGLATEAAGGNVGIEMGTPGFVMNDLMSKKLKAVFAWGMYGPQLTGKLGYKELVPWTEMGYGKKVPYVVLVVRKDILKKHPEIVQKVVQLNYDATVQALKVGDYKAPLAKDLTDFRQKYMGQAPAPTKPQLIDVDAQASPVFLKDVVDYMTKVGYFKVPYTYGELVDQSFYGKVKK
jgi:ABC-type nitrate/sulfonate/bicarbonate transport system substrate-binding protein